MKYRLGRKQGLAILYVETGKEYLVFPKGEEQAAKEYCEWLNNRYKIDYFEKYQYEAGLNQKLLLEIETLKNKIKYLEFNPDNPD